MEYTLVHLPEHADFEQKKNAFDQKNRFVELLHDKNSDSYFITKDEYVFGNLGTEAEAQELFLFLANDSQTQY